MAEQTVEGNAHRIVPSGDAIAMRVVIGIAVLFLAVAIIGPIYRATRRDEPPPPQPHYDDHAAHGQ